MRRRRAPLLRTLAIALGLGAILLGMAAVVGSPFVNTPFRGGGPCSTAGGSAAGFPYPFYWQCYADSSVLPPIAPRAVWEGVGFTLDFIVWYLVALAVVYPRYWPSAARRPFIPSAGILPPLASSSDDIGLTPGKDDSQPGTQMGERRERKVKE